MKLDDFWYVFACFTPILMRFPLIFQTSVSIHIIITIYISIF